MSLLAH